MILFILISIALIFISYHIGYVIGYKRGYACGYHGTDMEGLMDDD